MRKLKVPSAAIWLRGAFSFHVADFRRAANTARISARAASMRFPRQGTSLPLSILAVATPLCGGPSGLSRAAEGGEPRTHQAVPHGPATTIHALACVQRIRDGRLVDVPPRPARRDRGDGARRHAELEREIPPIHPIRGKAADLSNFFLGELASTRATEAVGFSEVLRAEPLVALSSVAFRAESLRFLWARGLHSSMVARMDSLVGKPARPARCLFRIGF